MSGKRFKGKLCVYCSQRPSTAGDHVFAREFFLPQSRGNLPQVPACHRCNNDKSTLEHYLTALLPFGGRHSQARENLASQVPDRLARNLRLARELNTGRGRIWHDEDTLLLPTMTVPLDPKRTCDLFARIGRGLAWCHWKIHLHLEHTSKAIFLSEAGRQVYARVFDVNAANRVQQELGNGTVSYGGVQSMEIPQLTIWRIRFYGGFMVAGDPSDPEAVSTEIGVATGPKHIVGILTEG